MAEVGKGEGLTEVQIAGFIDDIRIGQIARRAVGSVAYLDQHGGRRGLTTHLDQAGVQGAGFSDAELAGMVDKGQEADKVMAEMAEPFVAEVVEDILGDIDPDDAIYEGARQGFREAIDTYDPATGPFVVSAWLRTKEATERAIDEAAGLTPRQKEAMQLDRSGLPKHEVVGELDTNAPAFYLLRQRAVAAREHAGYPGQTNGFSLAERRALALQAVGIRQKDIASSMGYQPPTISRMLTRVKEKMPGTGAKVLTGGYVQNSL